MSKRVRKAKGDQQTAQGDLFIEPVSGLPAKEFLRAKKDGVVALGESTGHAHRFPEGTELYEDTRDPFVLWAVAPDAPLEHTGVEHDAIAYPVGTPLRITLQTTVDPLAGIVRLPD